MAVIGYNGGVLKWGYPLVNSHNYGKIHHAFFMGKLTISTGPCSIANCECHYQAWLISVYLHDILWTIPWDCGQIIGDLTVFSYSIRFEIQGTTMWGPPVMLVG